MTKLPTMFLLGCLLLGLSSVQQLAASTSEVESPESAMSDSSAEVNSVGARGSTLFNHTIDVSHSIGGHSRKLLQGSRYGCRPADITIYQGRSGAGPTGIPQYSVTITDICQDQKCTISNIIIACGTFNSPTLVDPNVFKRYGSGTCIVKNGNAMSPGETITFRYEEVHMESLSLVSSSINCRP